MEEEKKTETDRQKEREKGRGRKRGREGKYVFGRSTSDEMEQEVQSELEWFTEAKACSEKRSFSGHS